MTDELIERAEAAAWKDYDAPVILAMFPDLVVALKAARAENKWLRLAAREP